MEKMRFYRSDLNEYEIENNRLSYHNMIKRYCSNLVLCNNIGYSETFKENLWDQLDSCFPNCSNDEINEIYENLEIYQYYITDMSEYEAEKLKELNNEIVIYSDNLDCYILCVTHLGTSWDYVLTDVELEIMEG